MSIESIENASSWFDGPWSLLALLILATTSLIGANWIKKTFGRYVFLLILFAIWLAFILFTGNSDKTTPPSPLPPQSYVTHKLT